MKLTTGMIFMVAVLIIGTGFVAGGQVWVYSESWELGVMVGMGTSAGLWFVIRTVRKRIAANRRVRFLGESGGFDESQFVEEVDLEEKRLSILEKDVEERPDHVADSIRSLLDRNRQG